MNEDGTGPAFGTGSNWLVLVLTAVIYPAILIVGYLGDWSVFQLTVVLAVGVVVKIVLLVVGHTGLALMTKREPDDERIKEIERRASGRSGVVLSAGVMTLVVVLIGRAMYQAINAEVEGVDVVIDLLPVYALFGVFIVSELVRYGLMIWGSRV